MLAGMVRAVRMLFRQTVGIMRTVGIMVADASRCVAFVFRMARGPVTRERRVASGAGVRMMPAATQQGVQGDRQGR